jgi:CRP/FNR family transcriptional regulator, cyclic AMP receptor protein
MVPAASDLRHWPPERGAATLSRTKRNGGVVIAVIEVSTAVLAAHPFLRGMSAGQVSVLTEAARDVTFPARRRLFDDGGNATRFWLIRCGRVALDLHVPGEGPVVIETVGMGELLGWSWLFPPFRWAFGAITATAVEAFEFDAAAVRERCAADPGLGYELGQRISRVLAQRLHATQTRLIARSGYPA